MQLDALSPADATTALLALRDRTAHQLAAGYAHAQPFINQGRASGASIEHPHAQLVALSFVPPLVDTLLARFAVASRDILDDDLDTAADRGGLVRKADAVSWCPIGASSPYVVRVALRAGGDRFDRATDDEVRAVTEGVQDTLARLHRTVGDFAYNIILRTAPGDDDRPFHWWAEVIPRLGVYGGFELGTGVWVNPIAPEHAAANLRDA
jgi:UDPglucose--hexose-1-phosphate uridylyltransferase